MSKSEAERISRITRIGIVVTLVVSAYAVPHRLVERYHDWLAICDQIPESHTYIAGRE